MTNSYDKQKLNAYLLGSLPEKDIELLDELTFTDPVFADSLNAAEKDLVDSYANGELSGSLLERFESRYLASPIRRKNVQFARAFQEFAENEGLSEQAAFAAVPATLSKGKIAAFFESLKGFGNWQPILPFAAAAALLALVCVSGWLLIRGLSGRQGGDERASTTNQNSINSVNQVVTQVTPSPTVTENPVHGNQSNGNITEPQRSPEPQTTPKPPTTVPSQPVIATFVLFPPLRGGQKLVQVAIGPKTDIAAFTINLESNDYPSYRVELRDPDSGKSIWSGGLIKLGGKGGKSSLNVRVPAKLLKSQVYSFTVSGITADGTNEITGDYPFRVVR